jgi:hypothetical protein
MKSRYYVNENCNTYQVKVRLPCFDIHPEHIAACSEILAQALSSTKQSNSTVHSGKRKW